MNTSRQINIMVALVFAALIAAGAYTLWDPHRASEAEDRQLTKTMDRGAWLFSQNCVVCHGNSGEGGAASNRLKQAPALNRFDLQGRPSEGAAVDPTLKTNAFKRVFYTITCGRIGTAMPTWGLSQGGTLNDEQIKQLATFINEGTAWDQSADYAINGATEFDLHGYASANIRLTEDIDATTTRIPLSDVAVLSKGLRLQFDDENVKPDDQELVSITVINRDDDTKKDSPSPGTAIVTRALGTTASAPHRAGVLVLVPPIPPDPPSINGQAGTPACGQVLQEAGPSPTPAPPSTQLTITAKSIKFNTDSLIGVADQPLAITFENQESDGTLHNIHFFNGKNNKADSIGQSDILPGPNTQTITIGPLPAGQYYYQCDVHTQMSGLLTTTEAGRITGGGATAVPSGTPGAATEAAGTPSPAATP